MGLIPRLGRSPGEENDNPLQYSCLGNSMDRGAWRATAHGGSQRVVHNLATKQQQQMSLILVNPSFSETVNALSVFLPSRIKTLKLCF